MIKKICFLVKIAIIFNSPLKMSAEQNYEKQLILGVILQ